MYSVLSSLIAICLLCSTPLYTVGKVYNAAILCVPRVQHSVVFDCYLFPCYIGKVHFFLFIALSVILLLNLLIAMMGDTYAKVSVCLDPLFGSTK